MNRLLGKSPLGNKTEQTALYVALWLVAINYAPYTQAIITVSRCSVYQYFFGFNLIWYTLWYMLETVLIISLNVIKALYNVQYILMNAYVVLISWEF